jgi:hypothetical protein
LRSTVIVSAFQCGAAPETILRSFPSIGALVKCYGALTFYLENKDQVDGYMEEQDVLADALTESQPPLPDSLVERIRSARDGDPPADRERPLADTNPGSIDTGGSPFDLADGLYKERGK